MAAKSPLPPSVGDEAKLLGDRAPLSGSDAHWQLGGSIPPMYPPKSSGGARGGAGQTVVTSSDRDEKELLSQRFTFSSSSSSLSSSSATWTGSRLSSPQTCGGRGVCRHITEPTARLTEDQTWRTAAEVNTDELQLFRMFIRQQHCGTTPVCMPATGDATNTQHHA